MDTQKFSFETVQMTCQSHGQTKFFKNPATGEFVCEQCSQDAFRQRRFKQQRSFLKSRMSEQMTACGIDEHGLRFKDWQFDPNQADRQRQILQRLVAYSHKPAFNILLIGNTGTGKTALANETARLIFERDFDYQNDPAMMIKTAEFTRLCKLAWTDKTQRHEHDIIAEYANTGFLVLDDLGDGDTASNPAMQADDRARFGQLINERYQKHPTMITTNMTVDDVKAFLGARAWDRFSQNLIVVVCDWQSYRQRTAVYGEW